MTDDPEERRKRAGEAQRLLDEPLLNEVLDRMEKAALDGLRIEAGLETEAKSVVWVERLRAVRWLRAGLQGLVDQHRLAQQVRRVV